MYTLKEIRNKKHDRVKTESKNIYTVDDYK